MKSKIKWIFALFFAIILIAMTGCSNSIEILSLNSNPSEFSPDGDGVADSTEISCKSRSTIVQGVYNSQDELIVKYDFTIEDVNKKQVLKKTIESILDRGKAVKNGSNYEIEDEIKWIWDGKDEKQKILDVGRYTIKVIGVLYKGGSFGVERLAESDMVVSGIDIVRGGVEISEVLPANGSIILYRDMINIFVKVFSDGAYKVMLDGREGSYMRDGAVFYNVRLKKGINKFIIRVESGSGVREMEYFIESLQKSGDGFIKAEEGGIVEFNGRSKYLRGRIIIRANALPYDTKVEVSEGNIGRIEGSGVAVSGLVMIRPKLRLNKKAKIEIEYSEGLVSVSGGMSEDVRIGKYNDGEVELYNKDNVYGLINVESVGAEIDELADYFAYIPEQSNMVSYEASGRGGINVGREYIDMKDARYSGNIISVKADKKGKMYFTTGTAVYMADIISNKVKMILNQSDSEWGGGVATSLTIDNTGERILVAFAPGYIKSYYLNEFYEVKSSEKINGVDGQSAPEDGLNIKDVRFLLPMGLSMLPDGDIVVVDSVLGKIYRVSVDTNKIETIAGGGIFGRNEDYPHPAIEERLTFPTNMEVAIIGSRVAKGNAKVLFFADTRGNRIRAVNLGPGDIDLYGEVVKEGYITTVAGKKCFLPGYLQTFCGGYSGDGGKAKDALLKAPRGISYDKENRILYVSDSGNGVIRAITEDGYITTISGGGNENGITYARSSKKEGISSISVVNYDVTLDNKVYTDKFNVGIKDDVIVVDMVPLKSTVYRCKNESCDCSVIGMCEVVKDPVNSPLKTGEMVKVELRYSSLIYSGSEWSKKLICHGRKWWGGEGAFDERGGCSEDGVNKNGLNLISSYELSNNWGNRSDNSYKYRYLSYRRENPGNDRFIFGGRVGSGDNDLYLRDKVDVSFVFDEERKLEFGGINIGVYNERNIWSDPFNCGNKPSNDFLVHSFRGYRKYPISDEGGKVCLYYEKNKKYCNDCQNYNFSSYPDNLMFYDRDGTKEKRKELFFEFLDRIKEAGGKTFGIQLDYYLVKTDPVNPDGSEMKYVIMGADVEWTISLEQMDEMIEFLDEWNGKQKEEQKIKKIFIESNANYPLIWAYTNKNEGRANGYKGYDDSDAWATSYFINSEYFNEYDENKNLKTDSYVENSLWGSYEDNCDEKNNSCASLPMRREDLRRIHYSFGNYIFARGFAQDYTDIAKVHRKMLLNLSEEDYGRKGSNWWFEYLGKIDENNISGNIDMRFFNGSINTMLSRTKILYKDEIGYYSDYKKKNNNDYIKIDGSDCDRQEEEGLFNYNCLLVKVAERGRKYIDKGYEVLISVVNDVVEYAALLPYSNLMKKICSPSGCVYINLPILDVIKGVCEGCKFTTGFHYGGLKYPNTVLDMDSVKLGIRKLLSHPTIDYIGFNSYAPGMCIKKDDESQVELNILHKAVEDTLKDKFNCSLDNEQINNCILSNISKAVEMIYVENIYVKGRNLFDMYGTDRLKSILSIPLIYSGISVCGEEGIYAYFCKSRNEEGVDIYKLQGVCYSKSCWNQYPCDLNKEEEGYTILLMPSFGYVPDILSGTNFGSADDYLDPRLEYIEKVKESEYNKYLTELFNGINKPVIITEAGATFYELTSYSIAGGKRRDNNSDTFYGITELVDYTEQADNIEAEVGANNNLWENKNKVKGLIYYSDECATSNDLAQILNPSRKPAEKYLRLLFR